MNEAETKQLIEQIHDAVRLLRSGNRSAALLIYHDVKERSERNPAVELQLGHLCEEFGDIDEAVMHYEIVIEEVPGNAQYLSILGTSYLHAHELDKAHETLEKAIELDPELADAQHGLGVYYMRRLDHENAIGPLDQQIRQALDNFAALAARQALQGSRALARLHRKLLHRLARSGSGRFAGGASDT